MRFDRMRWSFVETIFSVKRIRLNRMRYFVFQCIRNVYSFAGEGFPAIDP